MPETANLEMVTIQIFEDPVSAQIALDMLQEEQIPAHLDNYYTASTVPGLASAVGQIRLVIPEREVERALTILEDAFGGEGVLIDEEERALFEGPNDLGPRAITSDLTCPKCFTLDIALARRVHLLWILPPLLLFVAVPLLRNGLPASESPAAIVAGVLGTGIFLVGSLLFSTASLPLRCKRCNFVGRRRRFYLMSDD